MQAVRRGGQGEHQHLEGDDHGEHEQVVEGLAVPALDPGDEPGAHGAADQDQHHGGEGDDQAVPEGGQEALGGQGVEIVGKAREALAGGELKGGAGADGGLLFQGVEQDHEDGIHPGQGQDPQNDRQDIILCRMLLCHYCCTSLERVAFSWTRPMTTTRMQKRTALAWP